MNILGIGPLLVIVGGIAIIVILIIQNLCGLVVIVSSSWQQAFRVIGVIFLVIGLWFWSSSAVLIKKAFGSHRLETSGVYRLSRNPMYAGFIVFIIPGIAFVTGNLLIVFVSVLMFVCFKFLIKKEEEFLRREFGNEFEIYSRKVAQLIPFIKI
jgi:protein-S-isoprenylcysteine O-methyltransferase Ste14